MMELLQYAMASLASFSIALGAFAVLAKIVAVPLKALYPELFEPERPAKNESPRDFEIRLDREFMGSLDKKISKYSRKGNERAVEILKAAAAKIISARLAGRWPYDKGNR